jgi:AcrR family transcriptional regulator
MTHIDRRLREKQRIKQLIIDAARELAAKEGWQAVTMRKIADKIEYTPPIVYEYFDGKEGLFKELIYLGFRTIHEEIEMIKQTQSDPKKLLLSISLILWDFARTNMDLFQLMFSLERPTPSKEMIEIFTLNDNIFLQLARNDKRLAEDMLTSWSCLSHGGIFMILRLPLPPHFIRRNKREIFISVMKRFIDGL